MKRLEKIKTLQLVFFIILSFTAMIYVVANPTISQKIGSEDDVHFIYILLLASLIANFLFIFLDLTLINSETEKFDKWKEQAAADPLSGLSNRTTIDAFIHKYDDEGLPQGAGVVILRISNIAEINKIYGRAEGDKTIKEFSDIMNLASGDNCYVGKNSGNSYIVLFEDANQLQVDEYLTRIKSKITDYNTLGYPLDYCYGSALASEGFTDIHQMISAADKRATESKAEE